MTPLEWLVWIISYSILFVLGWIWINGVLNNYQPTKEEISELMSIKRGHVPLESYNTKMTPMAIKMGRRGKYTPDDDDINSVDGGPPSEAYAQAWGDDSDDDG